VLTLRPTIIKHNTAQRNPARLIDGPALRIPPLALVGKFATNLAIRKKVGAWSGRSGRVRKEGANSSCQQWSRNGLDDFFCLGHLIHSSLEHHTLRLETTLFCGEPVCWDQESQQSTTYTADTRSILPSDWICASQADEYPSSP
jgi:hypothetical protein